jgi:hypothetical protein
LFIVFFSGCTRCFICQTTHVFIVRVFVLSFHCSCFIGWLDQVYFYVSIYIYVYYIIVLFFCLLYVFGSVLFCEWQDCNANAKNTI